MKGKIGIVKMKHFFAGIGEIRFISYLLSLCVGLAPLFHIYVIGSEMSFVKIVLSILGIILGKINFSSLKFVIAPASGDTPEVAVLYGSFIQNIVNFLIMAFVIFLMVKLVNKLKKPAKEEEAPAVEVPTKEETLLAEIRDILKNK